VAAAVGSGLAGASPAAAAAQAPAPAAPGTQVAPALVGRATDRTFRAFVRHESGASVETLRLLPRRPEEVVIRTQATVACCTIVGDLLSTHLG
jgi:hypothetical protein